MDNKYMKKIILFWILLLFCVLPKALFAQVGPPMFYETPVNELKTEFRPMFPDPLGYHLFPNLFATQPQITPVMFRINVPATARVFDGIDMVENSIGQNNTWRKLVLLGGSDILAGEGGLAESEKAHIRDIIDFIKKSGKTSVFEKLKGVLDNNRIYWQANLGAYAMIYQSLFWLILGYDYDLYLNKSSLFASKVKIEIGIESCSAGKFKIKTVTIRDPWFWVYRAGKEAPLVTGKDGIPRKINKRVNASSVFLMAILYHEGLHLTGVKSEYDAHTKTIWFLENLYKKISGLTTSEKIAKGGRIGDKGIKNIDYITNMFKGVKIKDLLKHVHYAIDNQKVIRFIGDYRELIQRNPNKIKKIISGWYDIKCDKLKIEIGYSSHGFAGVRYRNKIYMRKISFACTCCKKP